MKLLLYCTKAKPILFKHFKWLDGKDFACKDVSKNGYYCYNGKIVAECDFEVEKLSIGYGVGWQTETIKGTENIEKISCLSRAKLYEYCKGKGYAIHIKNLHIFDEPKELQEYATLKKYPGGYEKFVSVERAPQNMMYVYDVNSDNPNEKKVLISIRPEWLCKILNKEKTIEVRRVVLKEMLKND
jgi:predicted transcriptional regulator